MLTVTKNKKLFQKGIKNRLIFFFTTLKKMDAPNGKSLIKAKWRSKIKFSLMLSNLHASLLV